jgi:hypothetical protein
MKKKKATSKKPLYRAEGGMTNAEHQRTIPRQFAQNGGVAGALNRAVQKATQPAAKVAEMERKAQKAKR